jgi:hypothetical protein
MMSSWKRTILLTALLLACLFGATQQLRRVQALRPTARIEEVLYVSSPDFVRRISLGYTGLAANIYWTRAVQYFGRKHIIQATRFDLLDPLLRLTTALDPHLVVAYHFGSVFLAQKPPYGAGEPYKAIDLVTRGIEQNPKEWKLWVDLGFIHYMELNDLVSAAQALEQGSKIPEAHPFLKTTAASLAQRGGDAVTARALWKFAVENTKDEYIRENAIKHLRALEVDEVVPKLEAVVRVFRHRTGAQPKSFAELVAAGWLRRTPLDPLGIPYKLTPDGRVEVVQPDLVPFITKGLPPGRQPSIFDPYGAKLYQEKLRKEKEAQEKQEQSTQ